MEECVSVEGRKGETQWFRPKVDLVDKIVIYHGLG